MNKKQKMVKPDPIVFCTECGAELSNYFTSGEAKDPEKVKEHFKNCLENGKFKGDLCSRMFIATDFELPEDE